MRLDNIEAILFDSGKVLNGPKTGHWFISPDFFSCVNKEAFYSIDKIKRNLAFSKASSYINSIKVMRTVEEEFEHFQKFYEIFSDELPELQLDSEKIQMLAKDLVFNTDKYTFYDDVNTTISDLHKKFKLAVVSDAWPSLKEVFISAGYDSYFSSFVISSMIGVTKPDEKMYMTALEE